MTTGRINQVTFLFDIAKTRWDVPYVKGSRLREAITLRKGNKRILRSHAHFGFHIRETKPPSMGQTINELTSTAWIKDDAT